MPIYGHDEGKILATIGMTYYTRAVRREDVLKRYVPQLKAASAAITESIKRMSNALDTERAEWPGDVPARNGEAEPVAIGA